MAETMPNPMPDRSEDRQRVEETLQQLDRRELESVRWILRGIQEGRSATELLNELGGQEEAAKVVGETAAADLAAAHQDQLEQEQAIANRQEAETWVEIMHLHEQGASNTEIVQHFGGYDELERKIGSQAAASFQQSSKKGEVNG